MASEEDEHSIITVANFLGKVEIGIKNCLPCCPALLRCRCIDFLIPEQFGGGDMG